VVLLAVLQSTIVPHLRVWDVYPNLPLLVVVCWGVLRGARDGALWGFAAGVAVDLVSGAPFGAATLSLTLVGLLSGLGHATVRRSHVAFPMIAVFVATIVGDLVFLLILWVAGETVRWLDSLFRIVVPSALLNALLTPFIFWLARRAHLRLRRAETEL
jgi:rod shape-determining protein MreD